MSFAVTPTLRQLAGDLQSGVRTSHEACRAFLDRCAARDPHLHAFLHVDAEDILAQADASDKRRAAGQPLSPWDGLPVAIKDNIAVQGQPCRCASRILEPFRSPYDATVVVRLKACGIIPFGRANMDEFAMGSSTENSAFGPTRNPWAPDRVPGGSSGGSAAAVAAGLVPAALGSDTGGSIRQPAGFCGVVGLKPTYGRVSRYGLVAFASSLDQVGPLTRDVGDAALLLDLMGGHDPLDATSLPEPCAGFADSLAAAGDLRGVTLGLPKEYFAVAGLDPEVRRIVEATAERCRELGAELREVSIPHAEYAVATYYVIATAEASANLARFDGIRYGARAEPVRDLQALYLETRGRGFGEEVKRRILLGTFVLSSGYYDAYYHRAQQARTLIRRDFTEAFRECDAILAPVAPTPAFRFGEKTADPLAMYLADIYTIAVNLAGICGISIPAGLHPATRTPVGVQFLGPALGEAAILRISHRCEQAIGFRCEPPSATVPPTTGEGAA
jgi:aspartyl-tRNA(Asn)/glutamyl-tRNA(Gln) amidotransferase subunit A